MNKIAKRLLEWYQENRILYPWRKTSDPYKIWLSEILLQQTRIPVALPFFEKLVKQYPTVHDVAGESQDAFVAEWSGIGYYGRAKNMHACARELVLNQNGKFPSKYDELRKLPGIGRYTAGALRNLCFNELTPAVDGNVARVISRLTLNLLSPQDKNFLPEVEKSFVKLGKNTPAAEYFQALMELGEQICLPRPTCSACPVQNFCAARKAGREVEVPQRKPRKRSVQFFWYFLLLQKSNSLYFTKNAGRDFLRDAWLFPDLLVEAKLSDTKVKSQFLDRWKIAIQDLNYVGSVTHTVTFRKIHAVVLQSGDFDIHATDGKWIIPESLDKVHISSVVRKVLKLL